MGEIKSEKIQIKKKMRILWTVVAVLLLIQIVVSIIDYASYKKGQEFAIVSQEIVDALSDSNIIDSSDSYKEKCKDAYSFFTREYYDFTLYGQKIDYSDVRKTHQAVKDSFADFMREAGYDRFYSYNIENWFKFTNYFQFYVYHSLHSVYFFIVCGVMIVALLTTITLAIIRKRELIVAEDYLICKYSKKKNKQILIKDVVGVGTSKNGLKLSGNGFKYSISLITNAEELKSEIMKRKNEANSNSNVDKEVTELKKFKDLLDNGIISQEEFDEKKKQLLGL